MYRERKKLDKNNQMVGVGGMDFSPDTASMDRF